LKYFPNNFPADNQEAVYLCNNPIKMALQIVIISVFGLAVAQLIAVNKRNKIKKYFKTNGLSDILVCENTVTKNLIENQIDRTLYQNLQIVAIDLQANPDQVQACDMFRNAVRRAGIMRLPCLLHYDGQEITGKYYEVR